MRRNRIIPLAAAALTLLFALAGCGTVPQPRAVPRVAPQEIGGGFDPQQVVASFFGDLDDALHDPDLRDATRRSYWVERLASYFAPNERDDQRVILSQALTSFVQDMAQLAEDETLTLELRGFDNVEELPTDPADGQRATVRLPDAEIYMLITRAGPNGPVTIYEDTVGLDQLIGNPGKTVPLVNVGGRWYLTEG
ncbi:MAG: hypothetical protein DIU80_017075 [Chloroflexota bacterium]